MADEDRSFDPAQAPDRSQANSGRELSPQGEPAGAPPVRERANVNAEEDWGQPADEGATYSANHATRGEKTDAQRGPGPKTRQATKDQISRR